MVLATQVMVLVLVVDSMETLQSFESLLTSALTAAQSQPAQVPLVSEAVYAAVLLLRLVKADLIGEYV